MTVPSTVTRPSPLLNRPTRKWIGPPSAISTRQRARSFGVFVIAAAAVALASSPLAMRDALAGGADSADPAKAEALIRQANDMRRHGHDERALPLFRQAYEIARSSRTAGQLGLVEMALGYWVAASGHLDEALADSHNPWVERNRATLDNASRTALSHVGELRVEGKPDGAEVLVNGAVVGTLPFANALRLSEGRVNLEVRAPGRQSMTTSLTLAGRATERVQVSLERDDQKTSGGASATPTTTMVVTPLSPATGSGNANGPGGPGSRARSSDSTGGSEAGTGPRQPRAADEELPTWRRVVPWVLLGGAVVAGAIGAWQQVGSTNAQTSFDAIAGCGAGSPMRGTDPRCEGYYNDYEAKRTRAYVSYGVGGVLAAGAITMFIVNAVSTPTTSASADPPRGQALLGLAPSGAVLSYAGRF
jgi:hypothetical protein